MILIEYRGTWRSVVVRFTPGEKGADLIGPDGNEIDHVDHVDQVGAAETGAGWLMQRHLDGGL